MGGVVRGEAAAEAVRGVCPLPAEFRRFEEGPGPLKAVVERAAVEGEPDVESLANLVPNPCIYRLQAESCCDCFRGCRACYGPCRF